jgi:hypothetical protein
MSCGTYLKPVSFCEICSKQISWICGNCERMYNVMHIHHCCRTGYKGKEEVPAEDSCANDISLWPGNLLALPT